MYQKVSLKKITRIVKVRGEPANKGGKCLMERKSPRPRTVTIPPSKACTTGTASEPLRIPIVEDDTRTWVLHERTVDEKVIGSITEGTAATGAVAGQVGKMLAVSAIISDTAVLWVTRGLLATAGAFIFGAVDTEMACSVALTTTSRCSCDGFWAQAGITRCNTCGIRGHSTLVKGRSSVSRNVRRDVKQRSGGGLR